MTLRAQSEKPAAPAERIAIFDAGFRIFFLLAPLYGALAIALWVPTFLGLIAPPLTVAPTLLHAHEMIFGFAAAALAGFFLTAVPNWTGVPPLSGARLIALAGVWLLGRGGMAAVAAVPAWLAACLDLMFMPALALAVFRPLLHAKKPHNLMLLVPLALFWGADAMMQSDFIGWTDRLAARGARAGIDILLVLITLIGGRIIPTFTANALRAAGASATPSTSPAVDYSAIGAMVLLLAVETATGLSHMTGVVALLAALFNGLRLAWWCGGRTLNSPILWVLHLGYLWLVVGLALKGLAAFGRVPETAALHALALGAVGTMIFAVMSRAGLGHTGRPPKAHCATALAYGLVSLAAILRVIAAVSPEGFEALLWASGAAWIAAALLFVAVYAPIMMRPARPDGPPHP